MTRAWLTMLALGVAGVARAGELDVVREAAPRCEAARAHCFAIELHVALDGDAPVAAPAWIAAQLATANQHFASIDVGFELAGVSALPASARHVVTRADRNALGRGKGRLGGGVIHVYLVGALDDVDVPGEARNGVAWRLPNDTRKYLIVSAQARPLTLAHELGHFFGLPHSSHAISIMNKTPRTEPPIESRTFADEELVAMRAHLARLLRRRVLAPLARQRPVEPPPP